eukprot:241733_1
MSTAVDKGRSSKKLHKLSKFVQHLKKATRKKKKQGHMHDNNTIEHVDIVDELKHNDDINEHKQNILLNNDDINEHKQNILLNNDDINEHKQESSNSHSEDPDYQFALKLQEEYASMSDEKLALELQIEETHIGSTTQNNNNPSLMNVIGKKLMNIIGLQQEQTHTLSIFAWQRLPTQILKENDVNILHKSEENKTCSICMTDWKVGDKIRQLPCFHSYHKHCIDKWFIWENNKGKNASCPLDRKIVKDAFTQTF